ncbi:MAG TPA: mucoidy inhibitor MuiA family protein [bacterium]|nr:mucoidy inhibitor MuiA family protein [bacterium]
MSIILLLVQAMTVNSRVDSVVVYPHQVLVVRNASVTLSGPDELVFPRLPGALDDNSVRINAPGIRVGEVQVRRGYMAEPTPEVSRLQVRAESLEDQLKGLNDEDSVLKAKEGFLNSVKLGAPEIISKDLQQGKIAPESWRGALQFVGDELLKVKARQVKLGREKGEMQKKVDAARQEYNDAKAAIENRKEVSFNFSADAGTYDLRLSYVIANAADWSPYYELRANPGESKVGLSYFAKLGQRTGEDWNDVRVVLSTTTPVLGVTAPEPYPWYLSLQEPEHAVFKSRAIMPAPGAAMDVAKAGGVMAEEQEVAQPVETGISLQYVIPGRVSLKSGEQAKKLGLKQLSLPAEFEYYSLPRATQQAFLTGKMANTSDFVFLAGSGNTYVGDEYTGSTSLPNVASQESTLVSFGIDERVKVKRELVRSFKSTGGLFSKTEKQSYAYRTTVENHTSKPVAIKVVEQVPVSQQGEIKVTVTKVEPKFLEEDKDKGTYSWKPTIDTDGKFIINYEFTVEYPTGKRVQGLF